MPVVLFEIVPGAPLVFHCERLKANLSPSSCATNHRRCFNLSCASCPIGEAHAAALTPTLTHSPRQLETGLKSSSNKDQDCNLRFRQAVSQICIRCNAKVMRRVEPGLCVSCLNRTAEVICGRNSKGTYPFVTARRLYQCHALLGGTFPHRKDVLRFQAQCAPILTRLSGGAFITGVFSGRNEFDRWLQEHHPDAELVDFDLGQNLAELARHPTPIDQKVSCPERRDSRLKAGI